MRLDFWSDEDISLLKNLWSKSSISNIAQSLKRTYSSVSNKAFKIGLGKSQHRRVQIGECYGLLKVVNFTKKDGRFLAVCTCECGKTKEVLPGRLRSSNTWSCGCKSNNRKNPGESSLNSWEAQKKSGAKRLGRSWELTKEQFRNIVSQKCFWCNADPKPFNPYINSEGKIKTTKKMSKKGADRSWINVNGIDRVRNKIGYTLKNSKACCWSCNFMKRDAESKDFYLRCKRVVSNIESKLSSLI